MAPERWFRNRDLPNSRSRAKQVTVREWTEPKNREKFVTRGELLYWLKEHEKWVKSRDWDQRLRRAVLDAWEWLCDFFMPFRRPLADEPSLPDTSQPVGPEQATDPRAKV